MKLAYTTIRQVVWDYFFPMKARYGTHDGAARLKEDVRKICMTYHNIGTPTYGDLEVMANAITIDLLDDWDVEEGEEDMSDRPYFDADGPMSTASLPDGRHVIYMVGEDADGTDRLFCKVVSSTLDLTSGEWQVVPTTYKRPD